MATTFISSVGPLPAPRPGVRRAVTAVLGTWLALVALLGAAGSFVSPPGTPPLPILAGVVVPLTLFGAAYRFSPTFRELVLGAELPLLTGLQAWRFVGLGFIALNAHGVLPGLFTWPAGLGDMAIAISAPWVAATLVRRPGYAGSRAFRVWNLLGILDLVVAVGLGGLSSALAVGLPGEITARPMAEMPLIFIPAFFVPLFIILHTVALLQGRRRVV